MPRAVALHHDLPDGSSHIDILLARDGDDAGRGAGPVVTFQTPDRPSFIPGDAFDARRLDDHRPHYLEHEGEVPGGRGSVRRIAEGTVAIERDDTRIFRAVLDFGAGPVRLDGAARGDGDWRISVSSAL